MSSGVTHAFIARDTERAPGSSRRISCEHIAQIVNLQKHAAEADEHNERHSHCRGWQVPCAWCVSNQNVSKQAVDQHRSRCMTTGKAPAVNVDERILMRRARAFEER